jgi:hypothetical protein
MQSLGFTAAQVAKMFKFERSAEEVRALPCAAMATA